MFAMDDAGKTAEPFFRRARSIGEAGQYDYAIEMYVQGLRYDPGDVAAHQSLRELSLQRKAAGGKALSLIKRNLSCALAREDIVSLLAAEKLLAYDPGNTEHMIQVAQCAGALGLEGVAQWMMEILRRAQGEQQGRKIAPGFDNTLACPWQS